MSNWSVADISGAVQAGVAIAATLGGGLAFLWGRVEAINKRTKRELMKCHERETMSRERRSAMLTAFEFVLHALGRHDPNAPEISQSRKLIEDLREADRIDAEVQRASERG